MDAQTAATLTNFVREREASSRVQMLRGKLDAIASHVQALSNQGNDTKILLDQAESALQQIQMGGGAGVTDDFGPFSLTDQALRTERFAGKAAWVDFVKANPTCTEAQALPAYTKAALASRPADRQWLLHDPAGLRQEYTAELVKRGLIPDPTWESWRAFILATARDVLLGMQ